MKIEIYSNYMTLVSAADIHVADLDPAEHMVFLSREGPEKEESKDKLENLR